MEFSAITQLRLKGAFADSPKFQAVAQNEEFLGKLFEYSNRSTLFVHDDDSTKHSIYVENTKGLGKDKVFVVQNPKHKDVFLWHIDGILYAKDTKCDCAVLTTEEIKFVEFKSNAANNSREAIKDNYQKAHNQLLETFEDVKSRCEAVGVELTKVVKAEAYAVFNRTVPRNDAQQKNLSASFLKKTNIRLKFENETKLV